MRPLTLTISAFGPYAACVRIPMEELGEQGLYLITGDTGAGKSTIFDAICFALFGEASGRNRESAMFRSKYAQPSTPTFVEMTFLHRDQEYYIKRNPEYMRPAKKGEGEKKELPAAELRYPDGSVVSKVRDVNNAVEELLGVNRDQFSQIAMLAQGDFLELLLADTKKRMEIFRELFHTSFYQTLENRLEDERKKVYGSCEDAKKSVAQYISNLSCGEDCDRAEQLLDAKNGKMLTEDVITLIDVLILQDLAKQEELQEQLQEAEKSLSELDRRIGKAEEIIKAEASLSTAKGKMAEAKVEEKLLKEELEGAKERLTEREKMLKQIGDIEHELPNYQQLEELQQAIALSQSHTKQIEEKLSNSIARNTARQAEITKAKEELTSYKDAGEQKEKLLAKKTTLESKGKNLAKLKEEAEEEEKQAAELEKCKEKYQLAQKSFDEKHAYYEALDQAYRDGQAYILAKDLRDDMPCPVCGSKMHPSLAKASAEIPSEAALKKAKTETETAREEATQTSKALGESAKLLEAMTKRLSQELEQIIGCKEVENMRAVLEKEQTVNDQEIRALTEEIRKEEARLVRKEELEAFIPKEEETWQQANDEAGKLREQLAGLSSKVEADTMQSIKIRKTLTFESKKQALEKRDELAKHSEEIRLYHQQKEEAYQQKVQVIQELAGQIKSYEETVKQAEQVDLEMLRKERKELANDKDVITKEQQVVVARRSANATARERICEQATALAETEKRLQWMSALAYTANGKLAGKEKIMLETYIQTAYFERIIARANLRLMKMSDAQYELKRMEEASSNRGQSGLELGVIDHYNGSERSVKTLSGGESFMASLSLALGLSDEVQSMAGGIRVDTMFVDEGFGSLDPDSLQSAYNALAGLTEGNRLVGIISHVSDLKTKIEKQIVVRKEKSGGSFVTMQL